MYLDENFENGLKNHRSPSPSTALARYRLLSKLAIKSPVLCDARKWYEIGVLLPALFFRLIFSTRAIGSLAAKRHRGSDRADYFGHLPELENSLGEFDAPFVIVKFTVEFEFALGHVLVESKFPLRKVAIKGELLRVDGAGCPS